MKASIYSFAWTFANISYRLSYRKRAFFIGIPL